MKAFGIEQKLIMSRFPDDGNVEFISRVMAGVQESSKPVSRQSEIFKQSIRRTNVNNKETFIMKLKKLPAMALVALVALIVALSSGAAYAAYRVLWSQPEVKTGAPKVNQYGRVELPAKVANCYPVPAGQVTAEINKHASLKPDEVEKTLQAKCELDAIQEWANQQGIGAGLSGNVGIMASRGGTVKYDLNTQRLAIPKTEYTPAKEFAITPETLFIHNGQVVAQSDIRQGDVIAYVTKERYEFINGVLEYIPEGSELMTLLKLDLPLEYYNEKQDELSLMIPCIGNPQDRCYEHGSDLIIYSHIWQEGELPPQGLTSRAIKGRLMNYDEKKLVIRSSSGRLFTFEIPNDDINAFNANPPEHFKNLRIEKGDLLVVGYSDSGTDLSSIIPFKNISYVSLRTEPKIGEPEKY